MPKPINFPVVEQLVSDLEESLKEAVHVAKKIVKEMGNDAENVGPRIDAYLIGNLENFLENEHQCGSIPDIREGLVALQRGEEDD